MKKSLIAAGAASVAMAAMPVVGVFAVPSDQATVTDTVTLTVSPTCKMQAEGATKTVDLGTSTVAHEYAAQNGSEMTITCNAQAGWTLTAQVNSLTANGTTQTIPFGPYATGGESVWSAQVVLDGNDTTNATLGTGWDDFAAAKTFSGGSSTVVSGNSNSAVSGLVVKPSYKAYGAAHQAAGAYSGTIIYTFNDLTPPVQNPGA